MKSAVHLSSEQAYCLDQMGITRWQTPAEHAFYQIHRPANPWQVPSQLATQTSADEGLSHKNALDALSQFSQKEDGFAPAQSQAKIDPESQDKTVAGLRQELEAQAGVIVEDLQPIEELSVAIEPVPVLIEGLPQQLHCFSVLVANKLLILSDVPIAFHDQAEVEKLAIKMSQALLKQTVNEWQSGFFNWPGQLRNPFFLDRSDWMLGALESHIQERILVNSDTDVYLVLAGQNIQKVFAEIAAKPPFDSLKKTHIQSLPELYRIPELKSEAWKSLQTLLV